MFILNKAMLIRKAIWLSVINMNMGNIDNDRFNKKIIKAITNLDSMKRNDSYNQD